MASCSACGRCSTAASTFLMMLCFMVGVFYQPNGITPPEVDINDNLAAMAQALYDYWFVQFDFPDENGKPYKTSGGKMVWNEVLKREIPEGWDVHELNHYLEDSSTGDWGKDTPDGNYQLEVLCIRGADIVDMTELPKRYILEKNRHKLLQELDVVIEVSGGSPTQATGRCTFISKDTLNRFNVPLICSNFCQVLRMKDKDFSLFFYYMWKKFYDSGVMFGFEGKTSGIKNLLVPVFCKIKWSFPPKSIANKFGNIVSAIYSRLENNKKETQKLQDKRDFLLPLLMNGQIQVKPLNYRLYPLLVA